MLLEAIASFSGSIHGMAWAMNSASITLQAADRGIGDARTGLDELFPDWLHEHPTSRRPRKHGAAWLSGSWRLAAVGTASSRATELL